MAFYLTWQYFFLLFMIVLYVFLCILQLSVSAIDHEFDVSEESHPV